MPGGRMLLAARWKVRHLQQAVQERQKEVSMVADYLISEFVTEFLKQHQCGIAVIETPARVVCGRPFAIRMKQWGYNDQRYSVDFSAGNIAYELDHADCKDYQCFKWEKSKTLTFDFPASDCKNIDTRPTRVQLSPDFFIREDVEKRDDFKAFAGCSEDMLEFVREGGDSTVTQRNNIIQNHYPSNLVTKL
jgi:hypothetical protein